MSDTNTPPRADDQHPGGGELASTQSEMSFEQPGEHRADPEGDHRNHPAEVREPLWERGGAFAPWTEPELEVLREEYPKGGPEAVFHALKGTRTRQSIALRGNKEGLRSPVYWTKEMEELALKLAGEGVGLDEIARQVGRSKRAVTSRLWRISMKNLNGEGEPGDES